jgi:antirestriction protein ArdC
MARRDIHAEVTARILAAIEAGTRPWQCDWLRTGPAQRVTGEAYRGVNTLLLALAARDGGYTNPTWMTFKQAQALGGCVRKGERSTPIVFFTTLERQKTDTATGQDVDVTVPCIRSYNVFNVDQIDGLPADRFATADLSALPAKQRDEAAEAALRSSGATILEDGGAQAFYSRRDDAVHLPSFDRFQSVAGYLATLAHELVHWTGGKPRLDRTFGAKFGDAAYAFEELVAEIGAAFVCARLNVAGDHIDSHASYVGQWVQAMRADKRAIFRAASLAQAAVPVQADARVSGLEPVLLQAGVLLPALDRCRCRPLDGDRSTRPS